jgi:uncharacterized protein YndB with AHSA1/START domain
VKFENVVTIDRAPGDVFAYLADFEHIPRWNHAISETRKLTAGPVGVGTRYRQVRTLPTRSEEEFEVVEFEPNRRLAVSGDLAVLSGRVTYLLDEAAGATTLTNTMDLSAAGPMNLVAKLGKRNVQAAVAANLTVLKELLEHC